MGLETSNYRSPQLRSVLAKNLTQIKSMVEFKENVRKLDFIGCPYRLCKLY